MKYNKKIGKVSSVTKIVKAQNSFKSKKTENLAGGQAFTITDELGETSSTIFEYSCRSSVSIEE